MTNRQTLLILLLLATALPACASQKVAAVRGAFSFLNTYESNQKDYEHGHIMEARAAALSMAKDKPGYVQTQKLLKEKIEPARRRLLRHYLNQARQAKRKGIWFKARDLYKEAATFSIHNAALLRAAAAMDLKVRQVRLDTILSRRRKEDATLMSWLESYSPPPRQLDPQDEPFAHDMDVLQDWIEDRAHDAYIEAKRNLRLGYPEVAYADIESYLRFEPDSSYGQRLMKQTKEAMPKGLRIPAEKSTRSHRRPPLRRRTSGQHQASQPSVSAAEVRELMNQKRWLDAYEAAQTYQRENGKDADRLLKEVKARLEKAAEAAFKAGRIAFRAEDIDTAVKQWRRAVALQPDNAQYSENLHRAEQLQERLKVLRKRTSGH